MGAQRRSETEAYMAATALGREVRYMVGEQVWLLLVEGDAMGSGPAAKRAIERVVGFQRAMLTAQAVQERNRQLGLPLAGAIEVEHEQRDNLRSAVMTCAVAFAAWAAAMDFEVRRGELMAVENGRGGRRQEESI